MIADHQFCHFQITAFQRPKVKGSVCGDCYFLKETDRYLIGAVIDGLGSGPPAYESAKVACDILAAQPEERLDVLMYKINKRMAQYRGAVATLFKIDFQIHRISYCSIGNIRLVIFPPTGKPIQPLPKFGFLSGRPITIQEEVYPFPKDSVFVIHSDGLKSFTNLKLLLMDDLLNQNLKEKISRLLLPEESDDVTVLVGKSL